MRAQDIMTTSVVTATPDMTVREIAGLLLAKGISGVPVVDEDGAVVGIVSEGDLLRRQEIGTARRHRWWLALFSDNERAEDFVKSHGTRARHVMTGDVVTVEPDTDIADIATTLERHRIKRVPVVKDGRLVGIVSRANLVRGLTAMPAGGRATADDRAIRERLQADFEEAGIPGHAISIVVADGVVRVYGSVRNDAEFEAVRVALDEVAGSVGGIVNEVTIAPDAMLPGY